MHYGTLFLVTLQGNDSHDIMHLMHPLLLNTKIKVGIFATEGVINLVFNIVEGALTVLLFT